MEQTRKELVAQIAEQQEALNKSLREAYRRGIPMEGAVNSAWEVFGGIPIQIVALRVRPGFTLGEG